MRSFAICFLDQSLEIYQLELRRNSFDSVLMILFTVTRLSGRRILCQVSVLLNFLVYEDVWGQELKCIYVCVY